MLPTTPSEKWFKSLDSLTSHFYWKNKTPKISLGKLQKTKSQGGLEAPNFLYYFLANQLQYLYKWIHKTKYNNSWIELEQNHCKDTSISDLVFLPKSIQKMPYFNNITIASTLTAWWQVNKINKSPLTSCRHTPIWFNPDFQLCNKPIHFPSWRQKGITHLHHLFENNQFISFKTLVQRYGLGGEQFLQYQQIKSIIKSKINIINNPLHPPQLMEDIMKITNTSKLISKLHKCLLNNDTTIIIPKNKWEKDLTFSPNTDLWKEICNNTFSMTNNANLQLIQFKIIHRIHITEKKMFLMGLRDTDVCSQCTLGSTDDYFHALWTCQSVHSFWISVTTKLSVIMGCEIPLSPSLCLLNNCIEVDNLPINYKNPLLISLTIAKKVILQNWKSKNHIHINHWTNLLIEYITFEKITYTNKNIISKFLDIWNPFLTHLHIHQ